MNYETTNTKRKNCPACSFFNLINRQMCIKINRKVAFFSSTVGRKSQNIVVTHPSTPPPIFCRHSLKLLSPTLPKLMNWILLSSPPLSSDPDNPPKFGTCTRPLSSIWATGPLVLLALRSFRYNFIRPQSKTVFR